MDDNEVNKIIAEFMGVDFNEFSITQTQTNWIFQCKKTGSIIKAPWLYTKSLDALIPVWEKLDAHPVYLDHNGYTDGCHAGFFKDGLGWGVSNTSVSKTIQQAAAHATAKAILEFKKGV